MSNRDIDAAGLLVISIVYAVWAWRWQRQHPKERALWRSVLLLAGIVATHQIANLLGWMQ